MNCKANMSRRGFRDEVTTALYSYVYMWVNVPEYLRGIQLICAAYLFVFVSCRLLRSKCEQFVHMFNAFLRYLILIDDGLLDIVCTCQPRHVHFLEKIRKALVAANIFPVPVPILLR